MKKICILFFIAVISASLFGEIELGLSYTPGAVLKTDNTVSLEALSDASEQSLGDNIFGLHAGLSFLWLFYASVDSLIVPPWFVQQTTSYVDSNDVYTAGTKAPGYLNFIDIGIRPQIGPIYLLATAGINHLYIHSKYQVAGKVPPLGVNLRLGAGLQFGGLSIAVTGTTVFGNFNNLQSDVTRLINSFQTNNTAVQQEFLKKLMPSVGFILHL